MVNSESEVLPAASAIPFESAEDEGHAEGRAEEQIDDVDSLFQARASRPSCDDGWLDADHYFDQDLPLDSFNDGEWKEKYKDIDDIAVDRAELFLPKGLGSNSSPDLSRDAEEEEASSSSPSLPPPPPTPAMVLELWCFLSAMARADCISSSRGMVHWHSIFDR